MRSNKVLIDAYQLKIVVMQLPRIFGPAVRLILTCL